MNGSLDASEEASAIREGRELDEEAGRQQGMALCIVACDM